MNKGIFKGFLVFVCLVAASIGGKRAYDIYASTDIKADLLLKENIEAMSDGDEKPGYLLTDCYSNEAERGEGEGGYICDKETTNETVYSCPQKSYNVDINSLKYSCIYKQVN